MSRYIRQTTLPEVGTAGQERLKAADILVVGAGGLGCPALQYLVGAGIGRITVVDPDLVSLSNLHRQTLFREDQTGQAKVNAAARTLMALNSNCAITPFATALTPDNASQLIASANVVLDCTDSFAVSYILSDACLTQQTPLISASALGFEGYVGGFCANAPSLRAVFPDLPQRAATCATAGVMGPVVGTLGALQAQMAITVILGLDPSPLGQLVSIDLRNFRMSNFRFDTAPEPEQKLGFITPNAITTTDFTVDLRSRDEASASSPDTALWLRFDDFNTSRPTPKAGQHAVLICRSGLRAWQAARILQTYWNGPISLVAIGDLPET